MTQIATVEKKLGAGYVEISVPRKSACGHDCEECAGCGMTGAAIRARAEDVYKRQEYFWRLHLRTWSMKPNATASTR